jgi:hypothetical protein
MISRCAVFALLAGLLITGCATKENQLTPSQVAWEEKDQRLWVRDQEGRIP